MGKSWHESCIVPIEFSGVLFLLPEGFNSFAYLQMKDIAVEFNAITIISTW